MAVILIVEDDAFIRVIAEMMIEDWGIKPCQQATGDEAMTLLRSSEKIDATVYGHLFEGGRPWRV